MMKSLIMIGLLCSLAQAKEPSAFGAGSLDGSSPYGLTQNERTIVETRQLSITNKKKLRRLTLKIKELEETIEGLRTVISSMSHKIGTTGQRITEISTKNSESGKDEIDKMQEQLDALKKSSENNYLKLDKVLKNLLDSLGDSGVSSKKKVAKKPLLKSPEKTKSKRALLTSAISDYRAKRYESAKNTFSTLVEKGYKLAQSHYYLGEIAYYTKEDEAAISHYKASVGENDKASYVATLLLHTALSFKRLKDDENAQRFFSSLVNSYPDTPQAKLAKTYQK